MQSDGPLPLPPRPTRLTLFLDSEFTGLHKGTTLISLALVYSSSVYFYAEFTDFDRTQLDDWLKDNVLRHCRFLDREGYRRTLGDPEITDELAKNLTCNQDVKVITNETIWSMIGTRTFIKAQLYDWLNAVIHARIIAQHDQSCPIQIVSDCYAFDWVLFCDLFGTAFDVPKCINYIPLDLSTMFYMNRIDPDVKRSDFAIVSDIKSTQHNALYDAMLIQACFTRLMRMQP